MRIVRLRAEVGSALHQRFAHIARYENGRLVMEEEDYAREMRRVHGLGDLVWHVCRLTRLDRLAKLYERKTGRPCGCARRRRMLNRWLPLTRRRK